MKLNEFNRPKASNAAKALKEHYETTVNTNKLGMAETRNMLAKVKGLIKECKHTGKKNDTKSYMKLKFMEEALTEHYTALRAKNRLILENEEVNKSQVVLSAQDLIDTVQKMVENVSDMIVKELPAVLDGVNSEFGSDIGSQFNSMAADSLTQLQSSLMQAKSTLQEALGSITGQSAPMNGMGDQGMNDMGDDMGGMGDESDFGQQDDLGAPEDMGRELR
jgi:hypothetical protein